MHSENQSDWAEGLHLTVTGLNKDQRKQVRHVVEAAGGRSVAMCATVWHLVCMQLSVSPAYKLRV